MAKSFIDISVLGAPELQRALDDMKRSAARRIVRESLKKQAGHVAVGAAMLSPVDTGRMRESIHVANAVGAKNGYFGASVKTGTREELGIDPKDDYYYPAAVEFGQNYHLSAGDVRKAKKQAFRRKAGRIAEGKGISHRVVPPRPFMRRSFDGRAPQAFKIILDEIARRIEKAWKRAARVAEKSGT